MPGSDTITQIQHVLAELHTQLTQLQELLKQEHSALNDNDTEQISQLALNKQKLTADINNNETRRCSLFASLNLEPDSLGMAQLVKQLARPQVRDLAKLWQGILQVGQDCQTQNQINGIVLAHQQRRAMHLLQLLRGQTGQTTLYSARGSKESEIAQLSLARI